MATSLTALNYGVNNLTPNTTYYWKVIARDNQGNAQTSVSAHSRLPPYRQVPFSIAGSITGSSGSAVPNVVLNGFTGVVTTNAAGIYTVIVPIGWSGTITPVLSGYGFSPQSRVVTNVQTNMSGLDFTATVVTATNDPVLDQQIKIYPNPTTGPVEISLPESIGSLNMELYDAKGSLLYTKP